MSIKLRDYQEQIISATRESLAKEKKHVLVTAPTGSGKTVMFSYLSERIAARGKKVLIVTDRAELLLSSGGTLKKFGIEPYYIKAGTTYLKKEFSTFVAMSQTFRNRLKKPFWASWLKNEVDLIIIDEAHKQEFNHLFESELIDNKIVLGFTATPKRSGKMRQLAIDYEEIIEKVTVADLIKMGFLVADDYTGISSANVSGMKVDAKTGDYDTNEMFARFNSAKLYAGVFKNWKNIAYKSKTIIFCVNIEHVIHTCEEFQKNGIDARFVVSSMSVPKEPSKTATAGAWVRYEEKMRLYELYQEKYWKWSGERSKIFQQFENDEFPVLVNAGIATTGYDCPSIETVIINRATMSVTLWLQMIGRGSRIFEGKTHFNLLDFGENADRLGHYSSPRLWSLWHEESKGGTGIPPMKDCGIDANGKTIPSNKTGCKRMIPISTKICPFCGFKYPKKELKEVELVGAYYDTKQNKIIHVKKVSQMTDDELIEYAKNKGHKSVWIWRQLFYRGREKRIKEVAARRKWSSQTLSEALRYVKSINK